MSESTPSEAKDPEIQRKELFISYSHHDEHWLEKLRTHLKPLESLYGLERWDDSLIQPGDKWLKEIEMALARAQVALLLVSPQFLASDFIQRKELPELLRSADEDGLKVLWLPLRPSSWRLYPQIEQYQAIISPAKSLAQMSEVDQDLAMVEITEKIQRIFTELRAEQRAKQKALQEEKAKEQHEEQAHRAEREAERQRAEEARLEKTRTDSEARAEAEQWREEAECLAREKEEWQRKAEGSPPAIQSHPLSTNPGEAVGPPLIQIPATKGWLVREGNQWQKKEAPITVPGFLEELAEGIAITMIQIPAGEFLMGSPESEEGRADDEGPQHRVKLESFFLGQTPVTQAQWQVVAGRPKVETDLKPDPSNLRGANRPVEQVSWEEAMEFCQRLSQRTKREYSLPSEAQWEYACRAGTTTPFAFGETLTPDLANYDGNFTYNTGPKGTYREEMSAVGSFPANAWGLQDMHGNVWEWCLDRWHDSYNGAPIDGTPWGSTGDQGARLLRGGSWYNGPGFCRSAYRNRRDRFNNIGFRLLCYSPGCAS
ncbi:MAG: hypothetical protein RLZZ609_2980 [Cyanobacteriota bacterium]